MQKKFAITLTLGLLTSFGLSSVSFAAKDSANSEKIEVTEQRVTKEELAAIYVLSEICPTLIKKDDKFDAGFARLLKDYMPNEASPQTALKNLSTQADFKAPLEEARRDAKKAGNKLNIKICQDVKNY